MAYPLPNSDLSRAIALRARYEQNKLSDPNNSYCPPPLPQGISPTLIGSHGEYYGPCLVSGIISGPCNAQIILQNMTTDAVERRLTTSADGSYKVANLVQGAYVLTVVAPNFKTYVTNIATSNGRDLVINVTMQKLTIYQATPTAVTYDALGPVNPDDKLRYEMLMELIKKKKK